MALLESLRGSGRGRDLDEISRKFDAFAAEIAKIVAESNEVSSHAKGMGERLKDFRQEVETELLMRTVADAQEEATREAS